MTQRAEGSGIRVIPSHRADARDALPEIDPHSGAVAGLGGCQGQLPLLSAPANGEIQLFPTGIQRGAYILGTGNGCVVDFYNSIPDFQPRGFGGSAQHIIIGRHRHRIII